MGNLVLEGDVVANELCAGLTATDWVHPTV